MSKKALAYFSIAMIVVFGLTVVVYPLLFNPEKPAAPIEAPAAR